MRVIEGFKTGECKEVFAPTHDSGDAMAFMRASKEWPTKDEIDALPHTHGDGARIIADVVFGVLKALGLNKD